MVMATPMIKHASAISHTLVVLVSCTPTFSPMGIMAISAPSVKRPIPTINITAPVINIAMVDSGMGTTVMLSSSTTPVTGSTAASDSLIFSNSRGFKASRSFPMLIIQ